MNEYEKHGVNEVNNIRDQFGGTDLSDLWLQDGQHLITPDYVGLKRFLRIRYIGERMPIDYVAKQLPKELNDWMNKVGYKGRTVIVLDHSYTYALTRKNTVVRVQQMPEPIYTVSADPSKSIEIEINKALRKIGRNPSTMKVADAISYLH